MFGVSVKFEQQFWFNLLPKSNTICSDFGKSQAKELIFLSKIRIFGNKITALR